MAVLPAHKILGVEATVSDKVVEVPKVYDWMPTQPWPLVKLAVYTPGTDVVMVPILEPVDQV